jgi:diaminopimelate decarboxylase
MPMSEKLKSILFPIIPRILNDFQPPMVGDRNYEPEDWALSPGAHIYYIPGVRETIRRMQKLLYGEFSGNNFFAVKSNPTFSNLAEITKLGFGLDCASPTELFRAIRLGIKPGKVMFTSNNTTPWAFNYALEYGCMLNLDDDSFIEKLPKMPRLICFRYNPGKRRSAGANKIIGKPHNQKYGVPHERIVDAYRRARSRGAKHFGLHTMYASNNRDWKTHVDTVKMLLEVVELVQSELGIGFDFINMGGGLGIPYRPEHQAVDLEKMAAGINELLHAFRKKHGYAPKFFTESGRYVLSGNGVLAGPIVNVMKKYRKFIGVGFCDAADIMRAPMYPAYHEISILDPSGKEKTEGRRWRYDVVGPLCENLRLAKYRLLPEAQEGDIAVVHDTYAHGIVMGMTYNGWGKSQQLMMDDDRIVERIAGADTIGDLTRKEIYFAHQGVQY